jgi:hypothetical protein
MLRHRKIRTTILPAAAAGILGLGAAPTLAQGLQNQGASDDAWVALKGEVSSVQGDSFAMTHEGGAVTVVLSSADGEDAFPMLDAGDEAMVYGHANEAGDRVNAATVYNATDGQTYKSRQMKTTQ